MKPGKLFIIKSGIDINLVFSQEFNLYNQKFKYWFDGSEIQMIIQNNEQYREVSGEEDLLLIMFSPCEEKDATSFISTTQIMVELNAQYKIPISQASIQRIGRAGFYCFLHETRPFPPPNPKAFPL
jgi:hypothetical protein